jgi:hypothetical protein
MTIASGNESAERDHRKPCELKEFVGFGWKNGELMQGIFVLVLRAGIDSIHGNHNVVAMHPRSGGCGVKYCSVA